MRAEMLPRLKPLMSVWISLTIGLLLLSPLIRRHKSAARTPWRHCSAVLRHLPGGFAPPGRCNMTIGLLGEELGNAVMEDHGLGGLVGLVVLVPGHGAG